MVKRAGGILIVALVLSTAVSAGPTEPFPHAGETWTEPVTGMEFVWVEGGCFMMGQTEEEKAYLIKEAGQETYDKYCARELPRHEVCVNGFWMGRTEVTRGQFRQFVKSTKYRTDAERAGKAYIFNKSTGWKWEEKFGYDWEKPGYDQTDNHPVVCVSWNDAKEYASWLSKQSKVNFRLPWEGEWEYAARGGATGMRFWGPDSRACTYANVADNGTNWSNSFPCDDGYKFTAPAGHYQPNGFGLQDMLSNAWEWCEDVYDAKAYSKHSRNNPRVTSGSAYRVLRGGSWSDFPWIVRAAIRSRSLPDVRGSGGGFRLVFPSQD